MTTDNFITIGESPEEILNRKLYNDVMRCKRIKVAVAITICISAWVFYATYGVYNINQQHNDLVADHKARIAENNIIIADRYLSDFLFTFYNRTNGTDKLGNYSTYQVQNENGLERQPYKCYNCDVPSEPIEAMCRKRLTIFCMPRYIYDDVVENNDQMRIGIKASEYNRNLYYAVVGGIALSLTVGAACFTYKSF